MAGEAKLTEAEINSIVEAVGQRVLEKLQAELAHNITEMVLDRVAGACGLAMERALESGFAALQRRIDEHVSSEAGRFAGHVERAFVGMLRQAADEIEGPVR